MALQYGSNITSTTANNQQTDNAILPTTTPHIQLRGGNVKPQVETVSEEDSDTTQTIDKNNIITPTDTSTGEEYDPMADAPDPEIVTSLYVPLH